jgi:ParB family chromosome partitioning protein
LIRRHLTAAQRAKLVAKRKAAYEAVHPETKTGGRPGKAGGGKVAKNAKFASFAADTAAKSGKSVRVVVRDATRAKALSPDLDRVSGTSLDKRAELDALDARRVVKDPTADYCLTKSTKPRWG